MPLEFTNPETGETIEIPDGYQITVDRVDKETKQWSPQELVDHARQGAAASRRFQEAANLRKEAQATQSRVSELESELEEARERAQVADLMERARTDDEAFVEFATKYAGYSQQQAQQALAQRQRGQSKAPQQPTQDDNQSPQRPQGKSEGAQDTMDPNQSREFETIKSGLLDLMRENAQVKMLRALDSDPKLGKLTGEQKEFLVQNVMFPAAVSSMRESKAEHITDQVIQASRAAAEQKATTLGIIRDTSQDEQQKVQAQRQEVRRAVESVGPVETPLQEAIESGKTPDLPRMTDPNYGTKFAQAMAAKLASQTSAQQGSDQESTGQE